MQISPLLQVVELYKDRINVMNIFEIWKYSMIMEAGIACFGGSDWRRDN